MEEAEKGIKTGELSIFAKGSNSRGRKVAVVIYGKTNCPFCVKALDLARQYKLEFEYFNIENPDYRDQLLKIKPAEAKTVPQIWWHGNYIGGYNEFAAEIENTMNGYGEQQC